MGNLKSLLASRSPESQKRIEDLAQDMLLAVNLHELREQARFSQTDLAKTMGISQPSVVSIEQRGNELKISTLKRYIEALGGTLRLDVELPDGKHVAFNV